MAFANVLVGLSLADMVAVLAAIVAAIVVAVGLLAEQDALRQLYLE